MPPPAWRQFKALLDVSAEKARWRRARGGRGHIGLARILIITHCCCCRCCLFFFFISLSLLQFGTGSDLWRVSFVFHFVVVVFFFPPPAARLDGVTQSGGASVPPRWERRQALLAPN